MQTQPLTLDQFFSEYAIIYIAAADDAVILSSFDRTEIFELNNN